jgi:protein O-GlcNAc transferase
MMLSAVEHHRAGDLESAEECYERLLDFCPDHPDALHLLGVVKFQRGRLEEAVALLRRATDRAPRHAAALCNLGLVLNAAGDPAGADVALRRAIAVDPRLAAAHNTLGNIQLASGDLERAIARYQEATAVDRDFVESRINLANALLLAGRAEAAMNPCTEALRMDDRMAGAHVVMGNILASLGRLPEATASFRRACDIEPDAPGHWCCLAGNLESERKWDEALDCFDRAHNLDPDCGPAISGGLLLRKNICRWADLDTWSEFFAAGVRRGLHGLTPFIYLAEPSTAMEQLDCARLWSRHITERMAPLRARLGLSHNRPRGAKITIGYFSYDFRRHPTAYTKVGLFENHDRSRFRILGYCHGPDDGSDIRRRVIESFDDFSDVSGWHAAEVARQIYADGVDILVDLKGHTLEAPTDVFALRPAPIQVNYKGYPGTIGGDFTDYIVVDDFVVPEDQRASCSEAVVYLPETYWVDDSRRTLPAEPPSRAELGLPGEGVVFCGFNNSYKIRPEVFEDWMAILDGVPGSVMWIQNSNPDSSLADNLRSEATRAGMGPDRIVFAPRLPLRQYLGLFTVADLYLDSRPYNGHTTASDAIWSGLPVLTLPGDTFAARVAGSMLRTLGMPDLIAGDRETYRAIAIRLGRDESARRALRTRLESAKRASVLYDTARLTRHMERAYSRMYRRFVDGLPPEGFRVPPLEVPFD